MTQAVILTPISVCQTWPATPDVTIKRENILDAIETQLGGDTHILVVEGPEEAGKTTSLAQFAKRHEDRCLALFVSPSSRWAYDPNQMRYDLCNQLEVLLHGRELNSIGDASDALLGTQISELLRRSKRKRTTFYFVVDGLEEIPLEDETTRRMIVDLLPFGLGGFRFLFSGSIALLHLHPRLLPLSKTWFLSNFSLDESMRYFEGLGLQREHIEEFHRSCRGMPGYLASVRRLLENGVAAAELVSELPARLPQLFEIEWRKVEQSDATQVELLAFLAHERRRHTLSSLSALTGVPPEDIRVSIGQLSFVAIDAARGDEVRFVSESFRRFAATELETWKTRVHDKSIESLSRDPDADEAIALLPMYYKEADRLGELLAYLSPEHFAKFLSRSSSTKLVKDRAELGIAASRALHRDGDLVRFSLHNAAIAEIARSDAGRSEVRALAALGDYDAATALAHAAARVEDRLHLLAAIARTRREQGLPVGPELDEQIGELHKSVDYSSLGSRVESIAGDLAHTNIELAIEAVDRAAQASRDENELDWSLARLAIQASIPAAGASTSSRPGLRDITARIKDPLARRLSTEAALVLGQFSASEAIAEADRLDTTSDRLYVLRQWMLANRTDAGAPDVMDYAIRIAVQTTGYSANAAVFRELATCLPYMVDLGRARHLVGIVETHLGTLEQLGPTEDYMRLLLILARAEKRYDPQAAKNRLLDVYLEVSALTDLGTRSACTARFLSTLTLLDPDRLLEEKDKLHTMVMEDFEKQFRQLLECTADHYEATKGIIRALALAQPDLAIRVAQGLNTESRRDAALEEFVEAAAEGPVEQIIPPQLLKALDLIVDAKRRDDALQQALESVAQRTLPPAKATDVLPLLERVPQLADASRRGRACAIGLSFLASHPNLGKQGLARTLEETLRASWDAIDASWHKADMGFAVSADLAKHRPDLARVYADLASEFKNRTQLCDERAASAALQCVELAIRAYGGLLPRNLDTPEDAERIDRTIGLIPGAGAQARLWSELALRYYLNDRQAQCESTVGSRIKPLLRALPDDNEQHRADILITVAAALYAAFPASCLDMLDQLSVRNKDLGLLEVCLFLLRRCPGSDPYDFVFDEGYDITYETAVELCQLIHRVDNDSLAYSLVNDVADSVLHPREPHTFSRMQKGDIARLLRGIAETKFPNARHIKHEGYRLAALAQASRLQQTTTSAWDDLVRRARQIPNSADTAYVLSIIAPLHRDSAKRRDLVQEATQISEAIPTLLDRVEHYRAMSAALMGVETGTSKQLLKTALALTLGAKDRKVLEARRSLIDMAHRIDPKYAEFLASELNDDPARERVKRQLALLSLKRDLAGKHDPETAQQASDSDYSRAAWMGLGSLNAHRTQPVPFESALLQIERAARQPISQAYPVFAWLIENAVRKYSDKEAARRFVLPLFQAALLTAELAVHASSRSSSDIQRTIREIDSAPRRDVITVHPGARAQALAFITKWLEGADSYLKITDPYFGPSDLDLLRLIQNVRSDFPIIILTSLKYHIEKRVPQPFSDVYTSEWRALSETPAPQTEIVISAVRGTSDSPIHDRWWLTKGGGLEIGTSWNSLGVSKIAKIRVMPTDEVAAIEQDVDMFAVRKTSIFGGTRVTYQTVLLGDPQ
jgi:hypothetical protein